MATLWFFEDKTERAEHLQELLQDGQSQRVMQSRSNIFDAIAAIDEIEDEDWVSLDSQMPPTKSTTEVDINAGLLLAAEIRRRGKKCRIFWHSFALGFEALFERLGVETESYQSLASLIRPPVPVPEDASQAAAQILKALNSDAFETLAPIMVLLQGYLYAADPGSTQEENPVREDLRLASLSTAASEATQESEDLAAWRTSNWSGWFKPATKFLEVVEPLLIGGSLHRRFALLDETWNLRFFLENTERRRMFEQLGLSTQDSKALYSSSVEALDNTLTGLVRSTSQPSFRASAVCYGALQVLGLYTLFDAVRVCAHDVDHISGVLTGGIFKNTEGFLRGEMSSAQAPTASRFLRRWEPCRTRIEHLANLGGSINPLLIGYRALDSVLPAATTAWLLPLSRLCTDGWLHRQDWAQRVTDSAKAFDDALNGARNGGSGARLYELSKSLLEVLRAF